MLMIRECKILESETNPSFCFILAQQSNEIEGATSFQEGSRVCIQVISLQSSSGRPDVRNPSVQCVCL